MCLPSWSSFVSPIAATPVFVVHSCLRAFQHEYGASGASTEAQVELGSAGAHAAAPVRGARGSCLELMSCPADPETTSLSLPVFLAHSSPSLTETEELHNYNMCLRAAINPQQRGESSDQSSFRVNISSLTILNLCHPNTVCDRPYPPHASC